MKVNETVVEAGLVVLFVVGVFGAWVGTAFIMNEQNKHRYDDGLTVTTYNFNTHAWSHETYDAKRLFQLDNLQSYKER